MKFLFLMMQTSTGTAPATPPPVPEDILREYITNPFVVALLLIFVLGVILMMRYLARLPAQHAAIDQVQENYNELVMLQETDPEVIREELLKDVDRGLIVADRVEELHWIGVHGGDFDQVALAEVIASREGAKTSFARFGASILVLLGLCGAVFGLSNVVVNLGPKLREVQQHLSAASGGQGSGSRDSTRRAAADPIQESFNTLLDTMSTSLVHTRGAFYASLTGILLSVFLLMGNWWVGSRQVRFLTRLEDLTATKLIPIFKPPAEESKLADAVEAFKEGSGYIVNLSDDLGSRVSQVGTSLESLFAIVRKFGEGAEALSDNQERVIAAQQEMMRVVQDFVDLTGRLEGGQAEIRGEIHTVLETLSDSNKNLSRAVEEWSGKHETELVLIQQASERAHNETQTLREEAMSTINKTIEFIQTSIDRQLKTFAAQALTLIKIQQKKHGEQLQVFVGEQRSFVSDLRDSVANSDGHREMLSGLAAAITEERTAFSGVLSQMGEENKEALREIVSGQKAVLDISGMKQLEGRMERFAERSEKQMLEIASIQEKLAERLIASGSEFTQVSRVLKMLAAVAVISVPVFAAIALMFVFGLRPSEPGLQALTFAGTVAAILILAWLFSRRG